MASAFCFPTDRRLNDHLRCLAADADGTDKQVLGDECSGTRAPAVAVGLISLDHECFVSVALCRTVEYMDFLLYGRRYWSRAAMRDT
jgi:hypothetical protein